METNEQISLRRDFSKMDTESFLTAAQNRLKEYTEKTLYKLNLDIDKKVEILLETLKEILDKNIPLKKLTRKERKRKKRPWITKQVQKSIRTKNKIYKKICKQKFQDKSLCNDYKDLRNKITHTKEKAKKEYYHSLLQSSKGDIKKHGRQ